MSIDRRTVRREWRRVETPGREFENRVDLFPRYVELLDDIVDAGSGFEVLEYGGYRHPRVAEHPGAAESSRHSLHRGTLRPIKGGHRVFILSP
jgi:hypothetical protein